MIIACVKGSSNVFEDKERMATAIVEIIKEKGTFVAADLLDRGFTHEEVLRGWEMAYALAKVELGFMED